jgi:hypothetical protein
MITTEEQAIVRTPPLEPIISWGAIFAGLVFIVAGSMLLTLLGSAIGVSIIDASDMEAMGAGLATGAALWILLTALVVNFIGGLLAAHLSGRMTNASGLMHGVVVWAVAFVAMLSIDALAIRGIVSAGGSIAEKTASALGTLGGAVVSGAGALGSGAADLAAAPYLDEMRADLRRAAAKALSEADSEGGAEVSSEEMENAISKLDTALLKEIATEIATGDPQQARRQLQRELGLSAKEADEIVAGVEKQAREMADDSELLQKVESWLNEQLDAAAQRISAAAGPSVSRSELQDALQQLDAETIGSAARALLMGDDERAKIVIAANTTLSTGEIDAIVEGVGDELGERRRELQNRFEESVEAVSTYLQALLWLYFFTAVFSLGAAVLGGQLGASGRSRAELASLTRRTTVS